jgi:hypothetical protein
MSEFGSNKRDNVVNKTRAGMRSNTAISSADFIPRVFRTPLNKKWLGSTLDRMISKGDLEEISGYVGDTTGKTLKDISDVYVNTNSQINLQPAIVSFNEDLSLSGVTTLEDVYNSTQFNFDTFNFNAAYSSHAYSFVPPINIDKFINYSSYYWIPSLPIIELAINGDDGNFDPVLYYTDKVYAIVETDNGPVELKNGMRIRFSGNTLLDGIENRVYLVTGIGQAIHFHLLTTIEDIGGNSVSREVYTDIVQYKGKTSRVFNDLVKKDYIVIDRADLVSSAWSRANHWVHREVIEYINSLPDTFFAEYTDVISLINRENQAKRPIIEFDSMMTIMNHGYHSYDYVDQQTPITPPAYRGKIDYMLTLDQLPDSGTPDNQWAYTTVITDDDSNPVSVEINGYNISVGSMVVYNLNSYSGEYGIFYIRDTGEVILYDNLRDNDTFTVDINMSDRDMDQTDYYAVATDAFSFQLAQLKPSENYPPLFRLQDSDGEWLDNYPGSDFTGSKIFSYKEGSSSTVDAELGFPLTYKDVGYKAEIVFENNINNTRYHHLVRSSNIEEEIKGNYYVKRGTTATSSYIPSAYTLGAKTHHQTIVNGPVGDTVTLDIGADNWITAQEFIVFSLEGQVSITELLSESSYNRKRQPQPNIVIGLDQEYVFHNLYPGEELKFWDIPSGQEIETLPDHPVSITRDGTNITVSVQGDQPYSFQYGINQIAGIVGYIVATNDINSFYHKLYIDGELLTHNQYNINNSSIDIPAELVSENSIIDLYYYSNSNDTVNHREIHDLHTHNANNKEITELTISETIDHWTSIISSMPGFEGDAFGYNNYDSGLKIKNFGGEIFMHEDISIMHDRCFSDTQKNITESLYQQSLDWDSFRKRFISQVKRLYAKKTYSSVSELTNDAINSIINSQPSRLMNHDSNMIFSLRDNYKTFDYNFGNVYTVSSSINSNQFTKDHIYVYAIHNRDLDDIPVESLLIEGQDYDLYGNTFNFIKTLNNFSNENAKIRIEYYPMHSVSGVPASITKLGLAYASIPTVDGTKVICHDGSVIECGSILETEKIRSSNFNPVAGALLDFERRIYSGLRNNNKSCASSYIKYLGSQHRGTWYSRSMISDRLKPFMNKTFDVNQVINIYDENDPWTWNYKDVQIYQGHLNSKLPGYWAGAYTVLFGTHRPDLHPWHMLGFPIKPDWWDTYYTWLDTANGGDDVKRDALLSALRGGVISKPGTPIRQDLHYARYYWDFDNQCPVDTSGVLITPNQVLGEPNSPSDAARMFEFSDWAGDEFEWRLSPMGQAIGIDTVLKLNPGKAWTDFFQPGIFERNYLGDRLTNGITKKLISPDSFIYHGEDFGKSIKNVIITSGDSGIPNGTTVSFVGESIIEATGDLYLDDNGAPLSINMTNLGYGYTSVPIAVLQFPESYVPENGIYPQISTVCNMTDSYYWVGGINHAQENYIKRNGYDVNLPMSYKSLSTRLLQNIGGFTNKNLLQIETETGPAGKFNISTKDFELVSLTSQPSELYVASEVYIKKIDGGFMISGVSPWRQEFKYSTPLLISSTDYNQLTLSNGMNIKKYKNYSYNNDKLLFGSILYRIQDVYDFIRGYYHYLETVGYKFSISGDAKAIEFAEWAIYADTDTSYTITIGSSIIFETEYGVVAEFGSLPGGVNSILTTNETGDITSIDFSDLCITRDGGTIQIHPRNYPLDVTGNDGPVSYIKSSTQYSEYQDISTVESFTKDSILCVSIAVIEFDHAVLINNETQFNEVIFDDVFNTRHDRLKLSGQRTRNWKGNKKVPGYLVNGNSIIQNFDTAVSDINDLYDLNANKFNDDIFQAETMTVGNYSREWVNNLGLPKNVVSKFFQGAIRRKGTNAVMDRIGRSSLINDGRSNISISEEWMFKHSSYGDTVESKATEIEINSSFTRSSPVMIDLESDDIVYINRQLYPQFQLDSVNNVKLQLPVAGFLEKGSTDYTIQNISELEQVYDGNADYANVDTWSSKKSYKAGNIVRYHGDLWKASENIPYVEEIGSLTFTGTEVVSDNFFNHRNEIDDPDRPSAEIDGVKIWFDKQIYSYPDIKAYSDVDATVLSPATLVIDQREYVLTKLIDVVVISSDPYTTTGTTTTSDDVTGMTLQFTTLIDGDSNTYTVNLEDFGTEETIDTTPAPVTEILTADGLTDTFTLTGPYGTTTVTATQAPFTIVGDQITFDVAPVTDVTVTYTYTPTSVIVHTMTTTQLQDAIDSVPNISTSITVDNKVKITMAAATVNDSLTVVSTAGSAEFSITTGTFTPATVIVQQHDTMDIDYIVSQLGSRSGYFYTNEDNKLLVVKFATATTTASTTLEIQGTAVSQLGIPSSTLVGTPGIVNVSSTPQEAVDYINAAGISNVSALYINGRITITSNNDQIDLGDREFNDQATIPTGIFYADYTIPDNEFVPSQWGTTPINSQDTALFNVWVANDSALRKQTTSSIVSKFFDWSVLQVQTFRMWAEIEAGNETDDGNDAKISLKDPSGASRPYPVQKGDLVLILNSDTQPAIDGIHTVTGISTNQSVFYIDRFIENSGSCQSVMIIRPAKFGSESDLLSTLNSQTAYYNWNTGDNAWVTDGNGNSRYYYNGTEFVLQDQQTERLKNNQVESVLLYNGNKQNVVGEFELFDPIRGIIPGVADREIDFKSINDLAAYNMSNDPKYTIIQHNHWGDAEVGKVWWHTLKAKYYDYEIGSRDYRARTWGEPFPGSSIDIYEWTKSSVIPDEWENLVKNGTDQFGQIATGEAFRVYDKNSDSYFYYYSEETEWDNNLGRYNTHYYFWVKNKTTIPNSSRMLTVSEISNIVRYPTTNGISWFAPIDPNTIILENAASLISDSDAVLQIKMKPEKPTHHSWTAIAEGSDLIPEYWYIGLNDNLVGSQRVTGNPLPDHDVHKFNRYGDNRLITSNGVSFAQAWFKDPWDARREAISVINRLLKNMNLLSDLEGKWDRIITQIIYLVNDDTEYGTDIAAVTTQDWPYIGATFYNTDNNTFWLCTGIADDEPVWTLNPGFDMKRTWDWTNYVSERKDIWSDPTYDVRSYDELLLVDHNDHSTVRIVTDYDDNGLNHDEIYQWIDDEWVLVEKNNATIAFNNLVYSKNPLFAWDISRWEGVWDFDPGVYMGYIIKACREDLFIERFIKNFNALFFAMIKYTLSLYNQVDWVYKTTYIKLDIDTEISHLKTKSRPKKMLTSRTDDLVDYINTFKPFHTKIRTFFDTRRVAEDITLAYDEIVDKFITVMFNDVEVRNELGDILDHNTMPNSVYTVAEGINYNTGIGFTDGYSVEFYGGDFGQDIEDQANTGNFEDFYNWNDTYDAYRRHSLNAITTENLCIKVLTNVSGSTVDDDSKTYVYIQNEGYRVMSFVLQNPDTTQIQNDVGANDTTITVDDISHFDTHGGYAYIGGEIIKYLGISGNDLVGVKRGIGGTFNQEHLTGPSQYIVEITDSLISTISKLNGFLNTDPATNGDYPFASQGGFESKKPRSILDPNATDLESIRLQNAGEVGYVPLEISMGY